MASPLIRYICIAVALVALDGAIGMALVTSMVGFLANRGKGPFEVADSPSNFALSGQPANLIVDQGHTTNGTCGTALILVGVGGVLALVLEIKSRKKCGKSSKIFYLWALCTILNWLLTLTALIYTFVVTTMTDNQTIDIALAAANKAPAKYPKDDWTPENWYTAVLDLPLTNDGDRDVISRNVSLMRGWRFNIIPLFILGFVLMDLVILEVLRTRKQSRGMYGRAASGDHSSGDQKV
ncbi:hypothetical protein B0H66DRAFT_328563 [Apodospora peruviana]|uniref:Uncharacterized protein n=1 Tax=Apodospora peruviana TaxID=516989 RepID=A0AAE0HZS8_9PEZI|nr:hypothetical protein B0H66DRAFT_328563 [Apodospora peruviana]